MILRTHGIEVFYERAGAGPPLVLVHGLAYDARAWRPQLDALAGDFTVVAWDEPGAGRSSAVPDSFSLGDYADALAALVETVGPPAHLVGLSWGGTIVIELHRRRPELAATLILADTYAGWTGSLPAEEVRARVERIRQMLAAPVFDPTLPGLFFRDPPQELAPLLREIKDDVRPASLRTQVARLAEADLREVLPTVEVPTLLIWGEHDARSPLSIAREFEAAIPHAELVVIPGAGHMTNLEAPEEFNAAVREFCRAGRR